LAAQVVVEGAQGMIAEDLKFAERLEVLLDDDGSTT
jgi:hypothetical protein